MDFSESSVTALRLQRHGPRRLLRAHTATQLSEKAPCPVLLSQAAHPLIRNILAPTDFSPPSVEAVTQAAALARRYDALLTILHVIDINPPSARTHVGPADELMRQQFATGRAELNRLSESLAQQQTRTQARIIEGIPAEVIIENSSRFDLLVINEQRPRSAWRLFSQHTIQRVIEGVTCPLLVVHPRTEPEPA